MPWRPAPIFAQDKGDRGSDSAGLLGSENGLRRALSTGRSLALLVPRNRLARSDASLSRPGRQAIQNLSFEETGRISSKADDISCLPRLRGW